MVCFLWNVSSSPLTVQSAEIVNSAGSNVTSFDGCVSQTLQPGKRCGIQAYNVTQAAGRATVDVPRNRVRGTCQLLAQGTLGIVSSDMR